MQESSTIVEEVLQCFGLENSEETPLISGGEIDGEKKRRAVKSKEAFLGGGASCKRKKLKTLRQEDSSYGLEIGPSSAINSLKRARDGGQLKQPRETGLKPIWMIMNSRIKARMVSQDRKTQMALTDLKFNNLINPFIL